MFVSRFNYRDRYVGFQAMLRYCKSARGKVGFVVVENLSGFARNLEDQLVSISLLREIGVRLRSTYESSLDETSSGKLATNIFGAFNQFYSDSHAERQRDRTLQHSRTGRFLWYAPIGYQNERQKGEARIVPDPERAPFVVREFELMSTGVHKQTDVLQIVTNEGLRSRTGRSVLFQTFQKILRNPVYAGWIVLRKHPDFEPARGVHEALVSQETFNRVQAILDGRKPGQTQKKVSSAAETYREVRQVQDASYRRYMQEVLSSLLLQEFAVPRRVDAEGQAGS